MGKSRNFLNKIDLNVVKNVHAIVSCKIEPKKNYEKHSNIACFICTMNIFNSSIQLLTHFIDKLFQITKMSISPPTFPIFNAPSFIPNIESLSSSIDTVYYQRCISIRLERFGSSQTYQIDHR